AARERGENAAFGDAEYRPARALAAYLQTWIAVARDHEGVRLVVRFHHAAERQHHLLGVALRLDAERALGERRATDRRAISEAQSLQRLVEALRHRRVRIGVDDENIAFTLCQACVSLRARSSGGRDAAILPARHSPRNRRQQCRNRAG